MERISIEVEREILRLTHWHVSQRKIAKKLGIARGTVLTTIHGRHKRPRPTPGPPLITGYEGGLVIVEDYPCPGCGNKVRYDPCQICKTERHAVVYAPEPLSLDLREKHRGRYEALRAGKTAEDLA